MSFDFDRGVPTGPLDHPDFDPEGRPGSRFDNTTEGLDEWYAKPAEQGGGGLDGGTSWANLCTNCEPGSTTGAGGAAVQRGEPRPYRNLQPTDPNEPMGELGGNREHPDWFGGHDRSEPEEDYPEGRIGFSETECHECGTAITGTPALGRGDTHGSPYPKRLDQNWPIQQDARLASQQWAGSN